MKLRFFGVAALAATLLGSTPATVAAPQAQIDVTKITCGDLTAATPLDRAAMVMFYWGYAAAKAGKTTFKSGALKSATQALVGECSGNAGETVLSAMSRINVKAF